MQQQPLNTVQDFLDALARDPKLRDEVRRHILSEEVLTLPTVVGRPEPDEPPLMDQAREMRHRLGNVESRLGNVESRLGNVESRLGNVAGAQYEERIAHRAVTRVAGMGVERARIVLAPGESRPEFHHAIGVALTNGLISQEQQDDLMETDVILQGANRRHAVIEASLRPDLDDLQRAARRAGILARATGDEAIAVAVAPHFADSLRALAATLRVELVQIPSRSPDREE